MPPSPMKFCNMAVDGKDEWLTPPWVLEQLGTFDLDPCAPVNAPWPTARHHFTINDDGLAQDWEGRVFMNSPYGRVIPLWMRKMAQHAYGTALVFARTDTEWFFESVWSKATALLFLRKHLHFHHVTGERARHNSGAPSVLVAYGMEDADQLAYADFDGKFVPLTIPRFVAVQALAAEPSWKDVLINIMRGASGPVPLDRLYRMVSDHPKAKGKAHWREKVRQTLKRGPFERVDNGVWQVAG